MSKRICILLACSLFVLRANPLLRSLPRFLFSSIRSFRLQYPLTGLLFIDIRTWFSNVEQHATEGVKKILIGNKCDWEEKRAVSTERGQQLADELGIPFLEVSAKGNINVDKAFYSLASDIKKRLSEAQKSEVGSGSQGGVNVRQDGGEGVGGKCC